MNKSSEPEWISKEQVLYIHSELIRETGGSLVFVMMDCWNPHLPALKISMPMA
jgi:hypothetical protein